MQYVYILLLHLKTVDIRSSAQMMNSSSPDDLRAIFQSYIARENFPSLPLKSLSINQLSDSGTRKSSVSATAIGLIDSFCATKQTKSIENISLAFKCAYLTLHAHEEKVVLIKKHQHFVVYLNTKSHHRQALEELSVIYKMFTSSQLSQEVTLKTLLEGISHDSGSPLTLIISFQFFVIQSVLQMLSSRIQSIIKKETSSDIDLLWQVATMFLQGSRFETCLTLCDAPALLKYHLNGLKMLSGFVKVAEFINKRSPTPILYRSISALRLKVIEYEIHSKKYLDLEMPEVQDIELVPFVRDLKNALAIDVERYYPKLTKQLSCFRLDGMNQKSNSLCKTPVNVTAITPLDFENKRSILKYFEHNKVCLETTCTILKILQSIPDCAISSLDQEIIDKCVMYLTSASEDDMEFSTALNKWGSLLCRLLLQEKQIKSIKVLSRVCFEFSLKAKLIDGFSIACELDLASLSVVRTQDSKTYLLKRIEFAILSLFELNATECAVQLAKKYIKVQAPRLHDENTSNIIALCLTADPGIACSLFGKMLIIGAEAQEHLFESILLPLSSRLSKEKHSLIEDMIKLLPLDCVLASKYRVSQFFNFPISFTDDFNSSRPSSYIFAAGILINRFKADNIELPILEKVETYVLKWIEREKQTETQHHFHIFQDIVTSFYHMGLFFRCKELIEIFKKSEFKDPHGLLGLDLLLGRCLLELPEINQLTPVLKTSGNLLKAKFTNTISDIDDLVSFKLIQLEFFIKMRDEEKSRAKFDEISLIISSRPEYNIMRECGGRSLQSKLSCFMTIARLLFLASMINLMAAEMVSVLRNSKLSIKLLTSLLRKTENCPNLTLMKTEALGLLLQTYKLAFKASRHLGLTKDTIRYCDEFIKYNSYAYKSPLKSLNYFISANFLISVGKTSEVLLQFENGLKATWDSPFLELVESILCGRMRREKILNDSPKKYTLQVDLSSFGVPSKSNPEAFAVSYLYISDFVLDAELLLTSSDRQKLMELESSGPDKTETLTKSIFLIRKNLTLVCDSLASKTHTESLSSMIQLLPPHRNVSNNDLPHFSSQFSTILECKDALMHLANEESLRYLEVERIADVNFLLRKCAFLLSGLGLCRGYEIENLLQASYMVRDHSLNLPYLKQRASLHCSLIGPSAFLPSLSPNIEELSENISSDQFFAEVKEHLPKQWAVVTLDICEFSGDLMISRMDANSNGFSVITIPFDRKQDSKMNFAEYSREIENIIAESNKSTKSKITSAIKTKEARKLWWRLRFELDSRLGSLLKQMERLTIGALKGLFNTFDNNSNEYKSFRSQLNKTWRLAARNEAQIPEINKFFVDLFYYACLFEGNKPFTNELLTDLSELLVQHIGLECRSSKDQINQDWFIDHVSRLQPSRSHSSDLEHLIIIPSQSCVHIPWESMPFLKNRSVSRMPSMAFLVDSLKSHKSQMSVCKDGREDILYVLNPGSDLVRTQERFEPVFKQLLCATGLAGKVPAENWLTEKLFHANLYVYLGHGGGEQYLRTSALFASSVKMKTSLPTSLLMGCSSAAYQKHGNLPPTSNVFNWLVCGAPAVVTNLWDITDKDIDIFSLSLFAEWGLGGDENKAPISLASAMTKSRGACILQFLNGAAPILNGLPLTLRSCFEKPSLKTL